MDFLIASNTDKAEKLRLLEQQFEVRMTKMAKYMSNAKSAIQDEL